MEGVDNIYGDFCDDDGRFRQLVLRKPVEVNARIPLSGTMPPEVPLLSRLERIVILESELNSSLVDLIPEQLGDLAFLFDLTLGMNRISGKLTDQIVSSLPRNLAVLDLQSNEITGTIPLSLATLANLTVLDLSVDLISGWIPSELGKLKSLEELNLAGNQFNETTNETISFDHFYAYASDSNNTAITNEMVSKFLESATGRSIMPFEVCDLVPSLGLLYVDCGNVACPDWCNCTCVSVADKIE